MPACNPSTKVSARLATCLPHRTLLCRTRRCLCALPSSRRVRAEAHILLGRRISGWIYFDDVALTMRRRSSMKLRSTGKTGRESSKDSKLRRIKLKGLIRSFRVSSIFTINQSNVSSIDTFFTQLEECLGENVWDWIAYNYLRFLPSSANSSICQTNR